MMYNYTHVDEVLEKVQDEFGLEDIPKDSAMEHIWFALGKLGVSDILESVSGETIYVENHRGIMPNNIVSIEGIREKESGIPLVPSTDIFITKNTQTEGGTKTFMVGGTITNYEEGVTNPEGEFTPNRVFMETWESGRGLSPSESIGYKIKDGIIWCDIPNCELEITYKAFPIWDDNTPKIPDTAETLDFVVHFVAMKIAKKMYIRDMLSERKYMLIERDCYWTQGSARNKLLTPDTAAMESIRRMQMRLIPKPEQFNTGFKYLNDRERLK